MKETNCWKEALREFLSVRHDGIARRDILEALAEEYKGKMSREEALRFVEDTKSLKGEPK